MILLQTVTEKLRESLDQKGAEWISACWMLGWAVTLAMPGDTLSAPGFEAFHRFGVAETFWAVVFAMVGMLRICALYLNGSMKRGPALRIISSAFGVVTWSQVAMLLFIGTFMETGLLQPGPIGYCILALSDGYSLVRVAADSRYERR